MVKKNILQGMPTLLNNTGSLNFDKNWPFGRKLPPLASKNNQQQFPKVYNNKFNKTRVGKSQCGHPDRKVYCREVCKQCYNWFYNKISRKKKL